jgi:uncharacterized membrane protein YqaE (UPF0057 family)
MITFILEFDNHNYINYLDSKDNKYTNNTNIININKYTVKDLFINTIDKTHTNEFYKNICNNNYYFIKDNKLIHPDSKIVNGNTTHNTVNHIKCYRKQKGGFIGGSITGQIKDVFGSIIKPIIAPIEAIADVFIALYKFLKWTGLFVYWCWFFSVWLFTDLLNPKNFIDDFFNTIQILIMTIFGSIFNILMELFKLSVVSVGGWTQGFWGWDQTSLTQADKDSNYFKKINKNNNKKCYLTNTNTIPFSIILGTVLCPPVGVFMDMGLTGWFNILICILLTLLFYVPGLIYALLIIYS